MNTAICWTPIPRVAWAVFEEYRRAAGGDVPVVIASTANPFKFVPDVLHSLTGEESGDDIFAAAECLGTFVRDGVRGAYRRTKRKTRAPYGRYQKKRT